MGVQARDAATVIFLRERARGGGVEVLMVRRHSDSNFAGGIYVFPGGKLDPEDCHPDNAGWCQGIGPAEAAVLMPDVDSPAKALGFWVAGLREVFEESGLLLAYGPDGRLVSLVGPFQEKFSAYRQQIEQGTLSFPEVIRREGLLLATDRLSYFSHWITPETSPVRFDTRFFIAESPAGQEPLHDERETTENVWVSPRIVVEEDSPEKFPVVFPTLKNLEHLAAFDSVNQALESVRGKSVSAVIPRVILKDGEKRVVIPGDPEYYDTRYLVKVGGKTIGPES